MTDRDLALMTYAYAMGSAVAKSLVDDGIGERMNHDLAMAVAAASPPDVRAVMVAFTERCKKANAAGGTAKR